MVTIAVVAMGEMGSGVAGRLVERGARVVTSLAGRSGASAERAKAAGVEVIDDQAVANEADLFLSIVPPAAAAETAERFRPLIAASPKKPLYIDCNATAPQTLKAIAEPWLAQGLTFGDGSIIGWAPKPDGYSPKFYLSGPIAEAAETLKGLGIDTRPMSANLGDASGIKMAYAAITKGMQAIGAAAAIGAARAGAGDAFLEEIKETQPQIYAWLARMLPVMARKAYRWDDEMQQIARFMDPEAGGVQMFEGAAALYRHIGEENNTGPDAEMIAIIDRFVKPTA
ncbi:MAG TPA: DUF1932 domain-containing protein [Caulobacteraceae bacterium]|jgi:3-hydroxyisobutyrate dehydrogenase-like beta-hydroxyacid dehydrogenase